MRARSLVAAGLLFLGVAVAPAAHGFSYDDLESLIREKKLTSIDDVLVNLPREYLDNFALMRESFSLQPASELAPRAILFGRDASLMLSYNGTPKGPGYAELEVIQYRVKSREFEFHRVTFPKDAGRDGAPHFSGKNPGACKECHTGRLRPNWEQYRKWPGAYGELDDFPQGPEAEALKRFLTEAMPFGRYRLLGLLPGSELSPYETRLRGRLRFRPNFRLSALTFAHQADALLALLEAHPRFPKFRFLYALSRLKCDGLTLDPQRELKRIFGASAAGPFGPWKAPDRDNLYAYLIWNAGITPREWKPQLSTELEENEDPYFYNCGLPRLGTESIHELSDQVLAKLMQRLSSEIPAIAPHLVRHHWIKERWDAEPLDRPQAAMLDALMEMYDPKAMRSACAILAREYERMH